MKPTVLIADQFTAMAHVFSNLLTENGQMESAGIAGTGTEALKLCMERKPAVLVVHLRLPELDAVAVAKRLVDAGMETKVLVYTGSVAPAAVVRVVCSDACGAIHKNDGLDEWRKAPAAILRGERYYSETITKIRMQFRGDSAGRRRLTMPEIEVLQLLQEGKATKEMPGITGRTPKAIEHNLENLRRKFGVHERLSLLRLAQEEGYFD